MSEQGSERRVAERRCQPAIVERGHRGIVGLNEYLRDVLEECAKHPGDDLLSLLVHAKEQGKVLSSDEIVATSALLLVGYETTTHLIGNGLLALFEHPDQLQKLRTDPELAAGAAEEFLRYNSAVFQLLRRAREQVEIGGHVIHEGDLVIGLLHAANRDRASPERAEDRPLRRGSPRHSGSIWINGAGCPRSRVADAGDPRR